MPNPSIVAESLQLRLIEQKAIYANLNLGKETREQALRNIRDLEEELDLPQDERTPNHNGRPGGKHEPSPTDDGRTLHLTEEELQLLKTAAHYARDVAFLTVGDKEHPAVRTWERLMLKL